MPDPPDESSSVEQQRRVAATIGADVAVRHIFLCCDQTNPRCCALDRGRAAWAYLKQRLRELGLSERGGVLRTKANCLRICEDARLRSSIRRGRGTGAAIRRPWSGSSGST